MMSVFEYPLGATPIGPDEMKGLIPTHITTRGELDPWEQRNIFEAQMWADSNKPKDILNEKFMKQFHKRMFGKVWKWAGTFRQTENNIGVDWYKIPMELRNLFDDVRYWIENHTFPEDEIAARFHHRLVQIHLFPNGNGRHARLMANILLEHIFYKPPIPWEKVNLTDQGDDRKRYIESLQAADKEDYAPLLDFVRS
jgi:Fic-DOC domain mobile mystery protein B